MYSKDRFPETMVAIEEFKGHVSGGIEVGRLPATSVKTMDTFYSNGSNRQCVVEILALTEVLLTSNPDIVFVVLVKACKSTFCLHVLSQM